MGIIIWVLSAFLAVAFVAAGAMKAIRRKSTLEKDPRMAWVADFNGFAVKGIGLLEVLGGIALIVPGLIGQWQWLTPLAAIGLAAMMVGAMVVHGRRKEFSPIILNVALFVIAVIVAWARLGAYPA